MGAQPGRNSSPGRDKAPQGGLRIPGAARVAVRRVSCLPSAGLEGWRVSSLPSAGLEGWTVSCLPSARPEKRRAVSFVATRWRPPPPGPRRGDSSPAPRRPGPGAVASPRGIAAPAGRPWSRRGAGALGREGEDGGLGPGAAGEDSASPHGDRGTTRPLRSIPGSRSPRAGPAQRFTRAARLRRGHSIICS